MKRPLIVVVGETASGKSALALKLAEHYGGEIICADSRTVYRGMDIGTAKPTARERQLIPHHCFDIVTPDTTFTAAEYKADAIAAIDDVIARGKLPVMVGGTGLYVNSVLYDYTFRRPGDETQRRVLEGLSVEALQELLGEKGIPLPKNSRNPRHLIRAIETDGQSSASQPLRQNTFIIGLQPERDTRIVRISERVSMMLKDGLESEVRALLMKYDWNAPGLQTIGYQEWRSYLEGHASLGGVHDLIVKNTATYAKRQRTWFKRNNSIHWLSNRENLAEAVELTTTFLNN